jgi:hypothetical protein
MSTTNLITIKTKKKIDFNIMIPKYHKLITLKLNHCIHILNCKQVKTSINKNHIVFILHIKMILENV